MQGYFSISDDKVAEVVKLIKSTPKNKDRDLKSYQDFFHDIFYLFNNILQLRNKYLKKIFIYSSNKLHCANYLIVSMIRTCVNICLIYLCRTP